MLTCTGCEQWSQNNNHFHYITLCVPVLLLAPYICLGPLPNPLPIKEFQYLVFKVLKVGTGPYNLSYFGTVFLQQIQVISTATSGMATPNVTAHNCQASSLICILVHYP
jgi:hypothetical protein